MTIKQGPNSTDPECLPTGFKAVDEIFEGFWKGGVHIIASRPSVGKTTFMTNILRNLSVKNKIPGGVFYSEGLNDRLINKLIFQQYGNSRFYWQSKKLRGEEKIKLIKAMKEVRRAQIYIDDCIITTSELAKRAAILKKEKGIKYLIVDYLQLLYPGSCLYSDINCIRNLINGAIIVISLTSTVSLEEKCRLRSDKHDETIIALKNLAKDLDIPIIALSQLSKNIETRKDIRPKISDLRGFEEPADSVIFIIREQQYDKKAYKAGKDIAKIIIAKQRNGIAGEADLTFDRWLPRFYEDNRHIMYNATNDKRQ